MTNKYTTGTIQIATPRGMESGGESKIDPTGAFAITRLGAHWHAVTHIRTGLSMGYYVRQTDAKRAIKLALTSGVDWTQDRAHYERLVAQGDPTYAAFIAALRGVSL